MAVASWLPVSFERAALGLGATADTAEIGRTCAAVLERWQAPERHYHSIAHVMQMLANVEKIMADTVDPDAIRLAVWYHGIVFNTSAALAYTKRGGEDEVKSARTACEELCALGVPEAKAHRVAELIWAMPIPGSEKMDAAPDGTVGAASGNIDVDISVLKDAHMSVLAAAPQVYRLYVEDIRREYAHIPPLAFLRARLRIVHRLLERKNLFITPLGKTWEDMARQNLQGESERLERKIREIQAAAEGGDDDALAADSLPADGVGAAGGAGTGAGFASARMSDAGRDESLSSLENAADRLTEKIEGRALSPSDFMSRKAAREKVATDILAKITARTKAAELARGEAQAVASHMDSPLADKAKAEEAGREAQRRHEDRLERDLQRRIHKDFRWETDRNDTAIPEFTADSSPVESSGVDTEFDKPPHLVDNKDNISATVLDTEQLHGMEKEPDM